MTETPVGLVPISVVWEQKVEPSRPVAPSGRANPLLGEAVKEQRVALAAEAPVGLRRSQTVRDREDQFDGGAITFEDHYPVLCSGLDEVRLIKHHLQGGDVVVIEGERNGHVDSIQHIADVCGKASRALGRTRCPRRGNQ